MKTSVYVKGNWRLNNVILFWNGVRRCVYFCTASKNIDKKLREYQMLQVCKTVVKYGEKVLPVEKSQDVTSNP